MVMVRPGVLAAALRVALIATACAGACAAGAPVRGGRDPIVQGAAGRELDAWISSEKNFPGGFSGCVLVAIGREVVLEKGWGVLDAARGTAMPPDAIFDWASVTKQFTAAAVLKLEMQKKLALDDPITRHFKDAPKEKAKVTVRHLLDHTSGIPDDLAFQGVDLFSREAVVRRILEAPLVSEPGRQWKYNNAAYFLAGALIETASGTSYESYLRRHLFEPAGMEDAGVIGDGRVDLARVPMESRGRGAQFAYGPLLSWGYRGAGGVLGSVRDMLKWDHALRGDKLLSKAAKRKLYEPRLEDYALGWLVKEGPGGTRVLHGGSVGTIRTGYLRLLDEPLVVALACNDVPERHPHELVETLAGIARGAKRRPPRRVRRRDRQFPSRAGGCASR